MPDIGDSMSKHATANQHQEKKYHAYLLRLWCSESPGSMCWRASLEDPRSGQRVGFENLEQLFAFLLERTEEKTRPDAGAQKVT